MSYQPISFFPLCHKNSQHPNYALLTLELAVHWKQASYTLAGPITRPHAAQEYRQERDTLHCQLGGERSLSLSPNKSAFRKVSEQSDSFK